MRKFFCITLALVLSCTIAWAEAGKTGQNGVKEFLALQRDFYSGYDRDTCYNITPDSFGVNPDYSIFKYDASCASFLAYENEIYPLGEWFGGYGITSMALDDLNDDGNQELYFTYSFGSGLHRSHIAYFDPVMKRVVPFKYTHLSKDMIVAKNGAGGLSLYDSGLLSMESFVQFEMKSTGYITNIVYEDGQICLSPVPQEYRAGDLHSVGFNWLLAIH